MILSMSHSGQNFKGTLRQDAFVIRHSHLNRKYSAIRLLADCFKKNDPPLPMRSPISKQHLSKIEVFMSIWDYDF